MRVENFIHILGLDFFTGVADSRLKALCDYLLYTYGTDSKHHVIAANEGNSVALAAGYHLATGKAPVIYMQNSGQGNAMNPVASLLDDQVFAIPAVFITGWRGEPGVYDEPQHIRQGKMTCGLFRELGIAYQVIGSDTTETETAASMEQFRLLLAQGKAVAFVIGKDGLEYDGGIRYQNHYTLCREEIIRQIAAVSSGDPVIATTGMISRQLFEIRERDGTGHASDLLVTGALGHCSSAALGVALHKPHTRVWCIDGDGSVLMHMGALAVTGYHKPANLIHVVINNGAHESVGGMPTAACAMDLSEVAKACGYQMSVCVDQMDDFIRALKEAGKGNRLAMIEVKCATGSGKNPGRPSVTPAANKRNFMEYLGTSGPFSGACS